MTHSILGLNRAQDDGFEIGDEFESSIESHAVKGARAPKAMRE
jgi:hypothetical protein